MLKLFYTNKMKKKKSMAKKNNALPMNAQREIQQFPNQMI